MDASRSPEVVQAVIPTIIAPFALVSFFASAIATSIASLFGIDFRWEGPKRLLEVLLKPRVMAFGLILNILILGGYQGVQYARNLPSPLWRVSRENAKLQSVYGAQPGTRSYTDWAERENSWDRPSSQAVRVVRSVRQAWRTALPSGVFGAASLSGSSIFAGADDGHVYELDQADGRVVRKFFVGTQVTPEPAIWKDILFAGEGAHLTHHARIYSFDLKTGRFRGAFQTRGHTEGGIVIATHEGKSLLFAMAGEDGVYAVDPETMEARWHQKLGHTDSEVRVADGRVFFSTGVERDAPDLNHRAYALDFHTGKLLWKADLPISGWMPPVLIGSDVCFVAGEIYRKSNVGQLSCFDQVTGARRLSAGFDLPLMGIPIRLGSLLVVSDWKGGVCGVRWPDGDRQWCRPATLSSEKDVTYASVTQDGFGNLLFPGAPSGLQILSPDDGRTLLTWSPTSDEGKWAQTFSRVTVRPGDAWFITDLDGNIRKLIPDYEIGSKPKAQ